jgi:hypothetical protein
MNFKFITLFEIAELLASLYKFYWKQEIGLTRLLAELVLRDSPNTGCWSPQL